MSNPNFELQILEAVKEALFLATEAEDRVFIRQVTAGGDPEESEIDISPERTDLVQEISTVFEFLLTLNIDIDVPDDETDLTYSALRVHRQVNQAIVPEALKDNPFGLAFVLKIDPTGAEELSVGDEGQIPNIVRRTTWEVTYRSTRAQLSE